mmetsp:Transcript_50391/g.87970  ORF Transcript_50391/g.87970 Transcript_50391/m.87970 type:complete len:367 (+) Transcript_50391:684-1784(+)
MPAVRRHRYQVVSGGVHGQSQNFVAVSLVAPGLAVLVFRGGPHPNSLICRGGEESSGGGGGGGAHGAVEGHRVDLLRVARQLRQHLAGLQVRQQHVFVCAARQNHLRSASFRTRAGIRRSCSSLACAGAVRLRRHGEVRVHSDTGDARLVVCLVRCVRCLRGHAFHGFLADHCGSALACLAASRELGTGRHQLLHHGLLQTALRLLRLLLRFHCFHRRTRICCTIGILCMVGGEPLRLHVGKLPACLVPLLHQPSDHSAGCVVLVQGLGKLLTSCVEVLLQSKCLYHNFIPLVLERHKQTRNTCSRNGARTKRFVCLHNNKVINCKTLSSNWAFPLVFDSLLNKSLLKQQAACLGNNGLLWNLTRY